jgi:hypothetical protein
MHRHLSSTAAIHKKCRPCRLAGTATALLQKLSGRTSNYKKPENPRPYNWSTINRHRLSEAELKKALSTPAGWAELLAVDTDLHDELKGYKDDADKRGMEFPQRDLKWVKLNGRLKPDTEPKVGEDWIRPGIADAFEL